jgi:hypothetical protein
VANRAFQEGSPCASRVHCDDLRLVLCEGIMDGHPVLRGVKAATRCTHVTCSTLTCARFWRTGSGGGGDFAPVAEPYCLCRQRAEGHGRWWIGWLTGGDAGGGHAGFSRTREGNNV